MPQARTMDDVHGPEAWFHSLPMITRMWFGAALACTVAGNVGVVNPMSFVINWPGLRYKFEIWRLVTPFLYVGPFSIDTLFTLYMLVQYSQRYELGAYNTGAGGGSADAAFLLMFAGTIIHALCYLWLGPMLLVRTMIFVLLYCWTKREPNTQVSIFGFPIQARYLPFAILALDTLMGKDYIPDLVGIGVGHIFYFTVEIVPALYGKDFLHTPEFLINYFGTGVYVPPVPTAAQSSWPGSGPGRVNAPNVAASPTTGSSGSNGYNWGSGQTLGRS